MNLLETLKHYFGYDSLRPGQKELMDGILQGKDVLGIMPTGAGKSLCYQVPALMLEGITLVVSPLISLMSDQVKALNQAGVHAAYINSSLTENQIHAALAYAAQGKYKIIYVAPERLNTARFLDFAYYADISMVTVDEAHCISQWGQDFRPSYLEIADFLAKLPDRPVVSAFTATATERVKQDITESLHLQNPVTVVTGFDRPNLFFRVVNRKGGKETDNSILNYVKRHEDESGIIYCATKKNVDSVYALLLQYGIAAGRYHAGLSLEERKKNQDDFYAQNKDGEDPMKTMMMSMYMLGALEYFDGMDKMEIKKIAFEIAMIGTTGISPDKKSGYKVPSIPEKDFGGYQLLAYYYVSWALAIPEMLASLGLPFDTAWATAQEMWKKKKGNQ